MCHYDTDAPYRSLPEIHFSASGFFIKIFDRLCVFIFVSFLFLRVYTL